MTRGRAEAGFTLVEVLVGVMLLAMLATVIATGTRDSGRAWNAAERQTDEVDQMDAVQNLLRHVLAVARPSYAGSDPADLTIAFAGEPEALSLVAPQPATQDHGPWVRERVFLAGSGRTRAMFISWQPAAATTGEDLAPVSEAVLLDRVSALRFAYFGPPDSGQPAIWLDRWVARDRLPKLVRVAVERDGKGLRPWPDLVVATRINGNAGCIFNALSATCQRPR